MSAISFEQIRTLILSQLQPSIATAGLQPDELGDDLDLLTEGLIDSIGIVELVSALEKTLGVTIDFAELDPEHLTVLGPLCRYLAAKSNGASGNEAAPQR